MSILYLATVCVFFTFIPITFEIFEIPTWNFELMCVWGGSSSQRNDTENGLSWGGICNCKVPLIRWKICGRALYKWDIYHLSMHGTYGYGLLIHGQRYFTFGSHIFFHVHVNSNLNICYINFKFYTHMYLCDYYIDISYCCTLNYISNLLAIFVFVSLGWFGSVTNSISNIRLCCCLVTLFSSVYSISGHIINSSKLISCILNGIPLTLMHVK